MSSVLLARVSLPVMQSLNSYQNRSSQYSNVKTLCNISLPIVVEPVVIKFKNDYDINTIDRYIKQKLNKEMTLGVSILKDELRKLVADGTRVTTIVACEESMKKVENKTWEINYVESGSKVFDYINKTKPILDKYSYLKSLQELSEDDKEAKIRLIINFIDIARIYMKIDVVHEKTNSAPRCKNCNRELTSVEVSTDGLQICPCGTDRYVSKNDIFLDGMLKSVSQTKDYSDELNFVKTFHRCYGGQKITFDIDEVISILDNYFVSIGYQKAEYYKNELSYNARGKKDGTSLYLLLEGLKMTHLSKLYEDANYIGREMWGWKLLDILHLEQVVKNDYRSTQKVYEGIPKEDRDRKSSLSTQFRLFKHLQLRGVDCVLEDFKVPSQRESLCKQDRIWQYMCNNAGDPNIYYIPTL